MALDGITIAISAVGVAKPHTKYSGHSYEFRMMDPPSPSECIPESVWNSSTREQGKAVPSFT